MRLPARCRQQRSLSAAPRVQIDEEAWELASCQSALTPPHGSEGGVQGRGVIGLCFANLDMNDALIYSGPRSIPWVKWSGRPATCAVSRSRLKLTPQLNAWHPHFRAPTCWDRTPTSMLSATRCRTCHLTTWPMTRCVLYRSNRRVPKQKPSRIAGRGVSCIGAVLQAPNL